VIRKNGATKGPVDWAGVHRRIAAAGESRSLSREAKDAILAKRAEILARPADVATAQETDLRLATFALANEQYGIEAHLIVEIGRLSDYTPLPSAPPHLVGITNLRGEILPIFDLRALLGLRRGALDDLSRLVVLGKVRAEFGILADSTRELVSLSASELLPPPSSVTEQARHYMRGVTKQALVVLDGSVLLEDRRLFCNLGDDNMP
jgi:purine-binding chemotaxis protein CheW